MVHRTRRAALLRCVLHRTSAWVLVSAAVVQTACDGADTRSVPGSPTVPTRAVTSAPRGDPLLDFEISPENLRALYHAHHNLYRLSLREPGVLEKLEQEIEEVPRTDYEKISAAIGAVPAVRAALEHAKISPRDFYMTQYNLMNAVAVLEARDKGRFDNLPDVSERNVEIVRQNPKDVHRLMTERRPKSGSER